MQAAVGEVIMQRSAEQCNASRDWPTHHQMAVTLLRVQSDFGADFAGNAPRMHVSPCAWALADGAVCGRVPSQVDRCLTCTPDVHACLQNGTDPSHPGPHMTALAPA